jgi:hypothetical protein
MKKKSKFNTKYLIFVVTLVMSACTEKKEPKEPFVISEIMSTTWTRTRVEADFPYKKEIAIDDDIIKKILSNLGKDKNEPTKGLYINITVYLDENLSPVFFFISRSGWGIGTEKCDCFSYKDQKLGEELYDKIFERIQNYL